MRCAVPCYALLCLLSCSVDLASTFYALNPSGDLAATQATFQDWFRGMRGWEVRPAWPAVVVLAAAECHASTCRW